MEIDYYQKYLKYKAKYIKLRDQLGGHKCDNPKYKPNDGKICNCIERGPTRNNISICKSWNEVDIKKESSTPKRKSHVPSKRKSPVPLTRKSPGSLNKVSPRK